MNTAPLERLAQWMIANSFATGHGDTFEELLSELEWQVRELRDRLAAQKMHETRRHRYGAKGHR